MTTDKPTTGAWDYLPFHSTVANDFALSIQERLVDEIEAVFSDEERLAADIKGEGTLVPSLVLLAGMSEHHDIYLPVPFDVVETWHDVYMAAFEESDLPSEYGFPRMFMLEKVFATLMEHASITDKVFEEVKAGEESAGRE